MEIDAEESEEKAEEEEVVEVVNPNKELIKQGTEFGIKPPNGLIRLFQRGKLTEEEYFTAEKEYYESALEPKKPRQLEGAVVRGMGST